MRRATTPTHTFTLPEEVDVSEVTEALITYNQCNKTILEKSLNDLEVDTENNIFALRLSEAETNLFAPGKALIQIRVKIHRSALTSQMIWLTVKPALNSKEIL